MHTIGPEVMIFSLFTVADDWRAGSLESHDGVANGFFIERFQAGSLAAYLCHGLNQSKGARDTANGFGRNGHDSLGWSWSRFPVGYTINCT